MKRIYLKRILAAFLTLIVIGTTIPITSYAATNSAIDINSETLFKPSTLDDLKLNITSLPTVTVTGTEKYKINVSDAPPVIIGDNGNMKNINVIFDCGFDKELDATINVLFSNCGTLNSKSIDMKLTYSDIYSARKTDSARYDTKCFWWTACGTRADQNNKNEWFEVGFGRYNLDVEFYFHGTNVPVYLENAYLTLYSEDGSKDSNGNISHTEASCAMGKASNVYLYENTNMEYFASWSCYGKKYNDVYYGTGSGSTNAKDKNAVCWQYENCDSINLDMMVGYGLWSMGYHLNFIPLTACIPEEPSKSVSQEQATVNTNLTYTVNQTLPTAYDTRFKLKSLKLTDVLDDNLEYITANVFDENGNDITSTAGELNFDESSKTVMFDFNSDYLKSINYNGQIIEMKINVKTQKVISEKEIENKSITNFNDTFVLYSNTVDMDIYYPVTVNYLDEQGNKLADSVTNNYFVGEEYTTEKKSFNDYFLSAFPNNANGTIIDSAITVNYIYHLKDTSVVVNYIDENGNTLSDSININGKINDKYNTENKSIYGYELIRLPDNAEGIMSDTVTTVNYIYKLKETNVIVNYIDTNGNKLLDSVTLSGKVFDEYSTENKSVYGYTLITLPQNVKGIMCEDTIIVNYIYSRNRNTVTINYLEKGTDKALADSMVQDYFQGENYNVTDDLNKSIKYYSIDSISGDPDKGVVDNNKIVNVYYTRNTNNIVINFFDWITKEIISTSYNKSQEQGTEYNVSSEAVKDIPYYTYYDSDGNIYGLLLTDETINSYYIRNVNTITIKYIDKDTNEEISPAAVINQFQGTDYDVSEIANKKLSCYTFDSLIGNPKGFLTEDVEITVYYTIKNTSIVVNYIDTNNNKIADSMQIDGKVFDEYQTENKIIYGYELIELPVNAQGKMTEDIIIVDYVYKLRDTSVIINYIDEAGTQLADSITVNGKVFDEYQTESKFFYGYELVAVPDNANGKMAEEIIIINYVYKLKNANVEINYVDTEGNNIADADIVTGKVFEKYSTQAKDIHGYILVKLPDNANGEMKEDTIKVVYVYSKERLAEKSPKTGNDYNNLYFSLALSAYGIIVGFLFNKTKKKVGSYE